MSYGIGFFLSQSSVTFEYKVIYGIASRPDSIWSDNVHKLIPRTSGVDRIFFYLKTKAPQNVLRSKLFFTACAVRKWPTSPSSDHNRILLFLWTVSISVCVFRIIEDTRDKSPSRFYWRLFSRVFVHLTPWNICEFAFPK